MPIDIHGKQYQTVAERLQQVHEDFKGKVSITTEVLANDPVIIKATLQIDTKTFTGISAANPSKAIEKTSPYEVAETSAVGRALAFAGYAGAEIASAEEMVKAITQPVQQAKPTQPTGLYCDYHKCEMKLNKNGKAYHMDRNRAEGDQFCNGRGFQKEIEAWKAKQDQEYSSEDVAEDVPF